MSTLILTEKPSVARDIATVMDKNAKSQDGYIECNQGKLIITYAFGHLYKLKDDLMPQTSSEDELPFYPPYFNYELTSSGAKQGRIIKNLLKKASSVVIATDAGREGELIARLILNESGWTNWTETYRFWTSEALTNEAVTKGLDNLKPASNYDNYYYSAIARQHGDYSLGLNLSRIVSLKGSGRWSVGRVQTPILKILTERFTERENFTPTEYFVLESKYEDSNLEFTGNLLLDKDKTLDKETANNLYDKIKNEKVGIVKNIEIKFLKETSPVLHSLTSLQREANKIYGFTAQQTLNIAQELYEKFKVISYPRTDSNYLSDNDQSLASEILRKLNYENKINNVEGNKIFNSKKLTDHHALLPLSEFSENNNDAKKIYDLVKNRFLATFSEDFEYEEQKVLINILNLSFISSGKKISKNGWREFYPQKENILPELEENQEVSILDISNVQKFTKPPANYNDSSILKRMEILNLGTPATRAGILERLIKIDYISREKKSLIPTSKGFEVIKKLDNSDVTSAELTKKWEDSLSSISNKNDYSNFLTNIQNFTTTEVEKIKKLEVTRTASPKQIAFAKKLSEQKGLELPEKIDNFQICSEFIEKALQAESLSIGNCQICDEKGALQDFGKGIKCVSCERVVWKNTFGKTLTQKEIIALFTGEPVILRNLKSKAGKKYNASLQLKEKLEFIKYEK